MMMKLYGVPAAPNPTKVMLYLAERETRGAQMDIEQVRVNTLKGEQNQPEHLARNVFGALPTLDLEDGRFIVESLAIIYFLEDRFPEGALQPVEPVARGLARDMERTIETRFANNLGRYVHAVNSPLGLPKDPKIAGEIEAAMPKALGYIENVLSDGRSLLGGDDVSIADCTLQSALQFARFGKVDVIADYAGIRAWDERYRQRPAAQAVLKF
jgi:glutathione S-transferase